MSRLIFNSSGLSEVLSGLLLSFVVVSFSLFAYSFGLDYVGRGSIYYGSVSIRNFLFYLYSVVDGLDSAGSQVYLLNVLRRGVLFGCNGSVSLFVNDLSLGSSSVCFFSLFCGGSSNYFVNDFLSVGRSVGFFRFFDGWSYLIFPVVVYVLGDVVFVRVVSLNASGFVDGDFVLRIRSVVRRIYSVDCSEGVLELRGVGAYVFDRSFNVSSISVKVLFEVVSLEVISV